MTMPLLLSLLCDRHVVVDYLIFSIGTSLTEGDRI